LYFSQHSEQTLTDTWYFPEGDFISMAVLWSWLHSIFGNSSIVYHSSSKIKTGQKLTGWDGVCHSSYTNSKIKKKK